MSNILRKNEIAKILGMNRSTIRYYEQIGLIKPHIDDNQYRDYGIEELKQLSQINFLRAIDLDIKTIKEIMNGNLDDPSKILLQKKDELNDSIQILKNNIKKIEEIFQYSNSENNYREYQILEFPDRYLYALKSTNNSDLDSFYKENQEFFEGNKIELGDWFINIIDAKDFIDKDTFDFVECVEIKTKEKEGAILISKGKFACFDIVLNDKNFEIFESILSEIKNILNKNLLEIKNGKVLFLNKDNMNLNFSNSKRIISIQIPII